MLKKTEAIQILQKHLDTCKNQVIDQGWELGIAGNTIPEMIHFKEETKKQIEAYQMAVKALEATSCEDWVERCYLGLPCPYQHQN